MTVSRAALPREHPELAALREELAVVRAELVAMRGRLADLEQLHGARDAAEAACLLVIARSVGDRRFTSAQLMEHAEQDHELSEALLEADIASARELGKLLHRLCWSRLDGYQLERAGTVREGILWRISGVG